jgi:serine protease Do
VALAAILVLSGQAPAGENGEKRSQGKCPDFIDLIKDLSPSVVTISIERSVMEGASSSYSSIQQSQQKTQEQHILPRGITQSETLGSGFICDESGLIVTNGHVVEGAGKILVTLSTGKVVPGKVLSAHPRVDLALIKIAPPHELKKANIGDSRQVQVGEWVLAVGNPFGLGRTVTVGIVSGKGRFVGLGPDDDLIQTDASINPGNSGGPLFNLAGEVIGVNTAIIASGKGIGFSIPSNHVFELLTRMPESHAYGKGWLGLYVEDWTQERTRLSGVGEETLTVVDEVLDSAPAYQGGLRKGDVIVTVGGIPVRDADHLSRILGASKPGEKIRIGIIRENKPHEFDVLLGHSPH